MLNRNYDCTTVAYLRLGGESEKCPCAERYDRGDGRLRRGLVFVMTERARIEDTICFLIVLNGLVPKVDGGLGRASSELCGILIHVIEVILFWSQCVQVSKDLQTHIELGILADLLCENETLVLALGASLLANHIFDAHVLVLFHQATFDTALVLQ